MAALDPYDAAPKAVSDALAAADEAAAVRRDLRRTVTPGAPDRERLIADTLRLLGEAMEPVRSLIGRFVWQPCPEATEASLREASARLQYERKQIKKMRRRDA